MKYQHGSEYHKDNSPKLSKNKAYQNLATNATLLNIVMTTNKSQQRMSTSLEEPHSSTQGTQS